MLSTLPGGMAPLSHGARIGALPFSRCSGKKRGCARERIRTVLQGSAYRDARPKLKRGFSIAGSKKRVAA